MKNKITVLLIHPTAGTSKQLYIPTYFVKAISALTILIIGFSTFFIQDYILMKNRKKLFEHALIENEGLKGEAVVLMDNLDQVVSSLKKVEDYTNKLNQLTDLRVSKVRRKTGIGPLSAKEYDIALTKAEASSAPEQNFPLGIDLNQLAFRPVFDKLGAIQNRSSHHASTMQKILSQLSQQKSLLSSIPSFSPVKGWVASGYGYRISPFTGERSLHKGIDIASPIGTPVLSPADGVVIFNGKKDGFGNFIMIAHGYGIVSRYGHNAQNLVHVGQRVFRGEQIATVGMSGRTTGPHLHYEVVVNGRNSNPQKFILKMDAFGDSIVSR